MERLPPPIPPPVLKYGDFLTRYGIAYEVRGGNARLVIPNSRKFRYRAIGLFFVGVLAFYGLGQFIPAVIFFLQGKVSTPLPDLCSLGIGILFLAASAKGLQVWINEARRQTVLELDRDGLTVQDDDQAGKPRRRWWRRSHVLSVLPGPVPWMAPEARGLGLHIRLEGQPILEIMPGHPAEVAHWVADRLNEALAISPDVAAGLPPIAGDPDESRTSE